MKLIEIATISPKIIEESAAEMVRVVRGAIQQKKPVDNIQQVASFFAGLEKIERVVSNQKVEPRTLDIAYRLLKTVDFSDENAVRLISKQAIPQRTEYWSELISKPSVETAQMLDGLARDISSVVMMLRGRGVGSHDSMVPQGA